MASRPKLRRRRRTKIIATLGPSSSSMEVLTRLFQAGADVFRLNFSHGSHEDHAARIAMIRDLEQRFERPIGILADVQGPKLRVGRFGGGRVQLQTGQTFRLDLNPTPGDRGRVNLPHPEIIEAASIGSMFRAPTCNSWYNGGNIEGKARVFPIYLGGLDNFMAKARQIAADGYPEFEIR